MFTAAAATAIVVPRIIREAMETAIRHQAKKEIATKV